MSRSNAFVQRHRRLSSSPSALLLVLFLLQQADARTTTCKWAQSSDKLYVTFPLFTGKKGVKCVEEQGTVTASEAGTQQLGFSTKCGGELYELDLPLFSTVTASSYKMKRVRGDGGMEAVVTLLKSPESRWTHLVSTPASFKGLIGRDYSRGTNEDDEADAKKSQTSYEGLTKAQLQVFQQAQLELQSQSKVSRHTLASMRAQAGEKETQQSSTWQGLFGIAHAAQGKKKVATKALERAIALAPKSTNLAAAREVLGKLRLGQKKWKKAVKVYRDALKVSPGDASAYLGLGRALRMDASGGASGTIKAGVDAAGRAWKAASALSPHTSEAHDLLPLHLSSLAQTGDEASRKEALKQAKLTIKQRPELAAGYFALGQSILVGGGGTGTLPATQRTKAIKAFRTALSLPKPQSQLGELASIPLEGTIALGQLLAAEALEGLQRVKERSRGDEYDEAIATLQKAVEMSSGLKTEAAALASKELTRVTSEAQTMIKKRKEFETSEVARITARNRAKAEELERNESAEAALDKDGFVYTHDASKTYGEDADEDDDDDDDDEEEDADEKDDDMEPTAYVEDL